MRSGHPRRPLKGLALRVRYAIVQQDGGNVHDLHDFRVICNYAIKFRYGFAL